MARHFKESGDSNATQVSSPVSAPRGGDESYHAPAGNRHASTESQAVGYRSVISDSGDGYGSKENRRRKSDYADTDPYDIKGRRDPKKRRARIISTILLVVGIGLLVAAGGMYLYNQYQYSQQDQINEKLATYAKVDDTGYTAPVVDWASLKAVNPDVCGWIQIPGTVVNYPVYQGSTNDTYLRTNAEGNYSVGGQIFLDAENTNPGMIDMQTIIYGHHLYNGSMFKTVADMENQGMFDSVSTIWYVTENATYELQPVFAYKTDGDDENVRRFSFDSTEAFRSYLSGLEAKACAKVSNASDVIANSTRVLSLCTCSYTDNEYGRVILVCVPKSGTTGADATATTTTTDGEDGNEYADEPMDDAADEVAPSGEYATQDEA